MSTHALYLYYEGSGGPQEDLLYVSECAEARGFRVIDRGAYITLNDAEPELWKRQPFPGENPQDISCPMCEEDARTSVDGTVYLCQSGHYGFYEQSPGVLIEEAKWR